LVVAAGLALIVWAGCSAPARHARAAPSPCDRADVQAASLPPGLAIVPPSADVPPALAALSGVWCMREDDGGVTVLVVERVTPPTARVVYALGSTATAAGSDWWRAEASLSDGALFARPYPALALSATVREDGVLELGYGLETVAGTQPLTRVPYQTDEPSREFAGTYVTMFEAEAFGEGPDCTETPDADWLEAAPGSGFFEATRAARAAHPDQFPRRPFGRYRVRFIGHLSPPGHYGHLGGYERRVTVEQVIEVGPCPAP